MKDQILSFLNAIDAALLPIASGERLDLYHIGRSALVWKHGFQAATEDVDVVCPTDGQKLMPEALRLFGRDMPKAVEYGLYLQEVPQGLPPLWSGCYKRAKKAEENWKIIQLFHLEDHDFIVTKLKRFYRKDQEDIQLMCDRGLIDADVLAQRLAGAYPFRHEKDEDEGREKADKNGTIVLNYLKTGEWR